MSVILAIEPDAAQADVLRRSVPERVGSELVVVASVSAATEAIGQRVPDVLLFGLAIPESERQTVLDRVQSVGGTSTIPTFTIPALRGAQEPKRLRPSSRFGFWKRAAPEPDLWDPILFAEQIAAAVGKLEDARRGPGPAEQPAQAHAEPDVPRKEPDTTAIAVDAGQSAGPWAWSEPSPKVVKVLDEGWTPVEADGPAPLYTAPPLPDGEPLDSLEDEPVTEDDAAQRAAAPEAAPTLDVLADELARVRRDAEDVLAQELSRVRAEAAQTLEQAAQFARDAERAREEADAKMEADLARIREEAEQARLEHERTRTERDSARDEEAHAARTVAEEAAAQALEAEVARVRVETEARFEAELAHVRDQAEQARLAQEQAQRDTDSLRDTAAQSLEAEVARVRAEVEGRLEAEMARVREQAEQARLAEEQARHERDTVRDAAAVAARTAAEEAAAHALEAEVARVRAEAEARFEAELAHAREQASQMRQAQEQAQRNTDAASQAAARALEAEVARVRAEAEAQLKAEMARVRQEAEQARLAQEQAQRRDADTIRNAAAQAARTAAEQAAAEALEAEVSRVRVETEARFEAELARVREQAEEARLAQEEAWRESDAARAAAAGDVRRAAEASATSAMQEEMARVRAEAESRLEGELARVREEADRARQAQQGAQAEMARFRDQAVFEARAAAEAAVAEATRSRPVGHGELPRWEQDRREPGGDAGARWYVDQDVPQDKGRSRLGVWSVAASLALIAAVVFVVGVPSLTGATDGQGWLTRLGLGGTSSDTSDAEPVSPDPDPAPAPPTTPRPSPAPSPPPPAQVEIVPVSRFISVFSRIPLDLYLDGQRVGSTEDGQLLLPLGGHTLQVVNERFNFRTELPIEIKQNEVVSYTLPMPLAGLVVDTAPGAEIWVEGTLMGTAPVGSLSVQIGTREIVARHPDLGERRGTVEVKIGETAELPLLFDTSVEAGPVEPPSLAPLSVPPPRP